MHTICPNCLRPIRVGAKYCGYCGTALNSLEESGLAATAVSQDQAGSELEAGAQKLPGPTYDKTARTVSIAAIILLVLVILVGFAIRYWPEITAWLGQIIPWLRIR